MSEAGPLTNVRGEVREGAKRRSVHRCPRGANGRISTAMPIALYPA